MDSFQVGGMMGFVQDEMTREMLIKSLKANGIYEIMDKVLVNCSLAELKFGYENLI